MRDSLSKPLGPRWAAWLLLAGLALTGCSTTRLNGPAPVEDRGTSAGATGSSGGGGTTAATPPKPLPGAENAGKPGYYTVRPGDTMIRIGLETGQNWKDIARWNGMDNPNLLEVGQVIRVVAPAAGAASSAGASAGSAPDANGVVVKPVTTSTISTISTGTQAPVAAASAPRSTATASPPVASAPTAPAAPSSEEDVAFIWPASGSLVAGFDEAKNKGLDIAGKAGDAVLAAADGKVVYAGAGLRGYGNLVILKHNNTYLTAYAHNQTLLVREDQTVRKGQKIAEMGSSDADRVKLHFEIRKQGKPVDPAKLLPAR
jgi:lipoprotein NlpD